MINQQSRLAERFWQHGRLDDCPIIDMHAHMHESANIYFPAPRPEDMIRTMDRCGTRMTLFCSHLALSCPEIGEKANLEPARKYPDRFKAYHAIQVGSLNPDRDILRVESNPDVYVGFKFLCDYQKTALSDSRHVPYFEHANEKRLLILAHTWGGSKYDGIDEVRKIAAKYPNLVLICGHSFHDDWDNGLTLVEFPNVYYELTAVFDNRGVIERIAEKAGSERMLFGTDLPWFSTHHGVGSLLSADITDEDRHNILHRNGERLLSRFSWFASVMGA